MNPRLISFLRTIFISFDILGLNIVFFATKEILDERLRDEQTYHYENLWLFTNISWLVASYFGFLYTEKFIAKFETFCKKTIHTYIYFTFILILYLFFYKQVDISRLFIISILGFTLSALLVN